ncbi:hypothetical protein BCY91_06375 [Pelobium manganitolerans]|uniref:Molybdenum ABC transporter permease n=1 Tax=Pelobium manganitolerans TaxID=1842495 RepID=A0A419S4Z3_9SPHI|nr:hypothetical protein [Pelobium manganitolerans]RKD15143.1 hypothetical protein BCY91_06375 [Pelobium manganitolerans]
MEALMKLLQAMPFPTIFFVGLAIRLFVGMRQFNRRGLGGLQHFDNYFVGLITLSLEWILKWTAFALILWELWGWLFK